MVRIPDSLRCLFTAEIERHDDSFVVEVPKEEVDAGSITLGEIYRIAIAPEPGRPRSREHHDSHRQRASSTLSSSTPSSPRPPVREGERRTVTIETTGDQGDGIAKIERGYVVIVPGSIPGDELAVEIDVVKENFAIAEIVDGDDLTYE